MRGKVAESRREETPHRITPAYAGKRCHAVPSACPYWDHPRLCGEKALAKSVSNAILGSPPPMRGKVNVFARTSNLQGITPAYAGKSGIINIENNTRGDHPRLCGEKTKKIPKQRYFFHQPASFSFSLQYT